MTDRFNLNSIITFKSCSWSYVRSLTGTSMSSRFLSFFCWVWDKILARHRTHYRKTDHVVLLWISLIGSEEPITIIVYLLSGYAASQVMVYNRNSIFGEVNIELYKGYALWIQKENKFSRCNSRAVVLTHAIIFLVTYMLSSTFKWGYCVFSDSVVPVKHKITTRSHKMLHDGCQWLYYHIKMCDEPYLENNLNLIWRQTQSSKCLILSWVVGKDHHSLGCMGAACSPVTHIQSTSLFPVLGVWRAHVTLQSPNGSDYQVIH